MKEKTKIDSRGMTLAQAKRLIADRPGLSELFGRFRLQAATPPHAIGDAAALAIAVAFELGRARGVDHAADRVSGVLRSLELEASDHA